MCLQLFPMLNYRQRSTRALGPTHAKQTPPLICLKHNNSMLTSAGCMQQYGQTAAPAAAAGSAYAASGQQQQQAAPTTAGGFGMQTTRPAGVGHLIPGPSGAASSYGGQAASSAPGGYSASPAAARPAANRQGTLAGMGAQVRRLSSWSVMASCQESK